MLNSNLFLQNPRVLLSKVIWNIFIKNIKCQIWHSSYSPYSPFSLSRCWSSLYPPTRSQNDKVPTWGKCQDCLLQKQHVTIYQEHTSGPIQEVSSPRKGRSSKESQATHRWNGCWLSPSAVLMWRAKLFSVTDQIWMFLNILGRNSH